MSRPSVRHALKTRAARIFSWWEHRILWEPKDWIQIEVTSLCNASCTYCPRTILQRQWLNRSMSMSTFRRILPVLPKAGLVHLQGWGEPLLHPDFSRMARLARQAGCAVSATTNGNLLSEQRFVELMDAGMDILAVSLAGTSSKVNDAFRPGAPLAGALRALKMARDVKQKRRSAKPEMHIAYMLLRSGLNDLDALPELMAGHGVEQCVVSVLDFVPDRKLADQVLAPESRGERQELEKRFNRLRAEARERGLIIHTPCLASGLDNAKGCTENVGQALVITADGEVAPCVFSNLPVRPGGPDPVRQCSRLTFGNVNHEHLPVIWRKKAYQRFREDLGQGRPWEICRCCSKLGRMGGCENSGP